MITDVQVDDTNVTYNTSSNAYKLEKDTEASSGYGVKITRIQVTKPKPQPQPTPSPSPSPSAYELELDVPQDVLDLINSNWLDGSNAWVEDFFNISPEQSQNYDYNLINLAANSGLQLSRLSGSVELARELTNNTLNLIPNDNFSKGYSRFAQFSVDDIGQKANNYNQLQMIKPYITMWAQPNVSSSSNRKQKGGYYLNAAIKTGIIGTTLGSSINYGRNNNYQSGVMIFIGSGNAKNTNKTIKTENDASCYGGITYTKLKLNNSFNVLGYASIYTLNNDIKQNNLVPLYGSNKANIYQLGANAQYDINLTHSKDPYVLTPSIGLEFEYYKQNDLNVKYIDTNRYSAKLEKSAFLAKGWNYSLINLPIKLDLSKRFTFDTDNYLVTDVTIGYKPSFGKVAQKSDLKLTGFDRAVGIDDAKVADKQAALFALKAQWQQKNFRAGANYETQYSAHHLSQFFGLDFALNI